MKSILKKIIFVMFILILLFSINSEVFGLSEIISDGKAFLQNGQSQVDMTKLQGLSGYLYNILLAAGVIIAVIVATILGIQFMMGGAEGQAKVKEMVLPFVVGCIIVFGGFGIWKIAITMGETLEGAAGTVDWINSEGTYWLDGADLYCGKCKQLLSMDERTNSQCECGNSLETQVNYKELNPEGTYWVDGADLYCGKCKKVIETIEERINSQCKCGNPLKTQIQYKY